MHPALERIDWQRFLGRPLLMPFSNEEDARLRGCSVLITGAGGSIGSALARRLARMGVARLDLLDASEGHLHALQMLPDQAHAHGQIALHLGSVTDAALLEEIFSLHKPELVFHAAAFKQVPLLEDQPLAAITNNIFGTQALVDCASRHGARVVLLSTDKAVEPASIMGATKRLAEQMVLGTGGLVVRLGNVLASRDSVAEVFAEQIMHGGPITVTDPAARRYFLTLEEAVDSLLATAFAANRPALFVPDLREPHFIVDLARFLAAELAPDRKTKVAFSHLRPGDKETERLWSPRETAEPAAIPGFLRVKTELPTMSVLQEHLDAMHRAVQTRNAGAAMEAMVSIVPDYTPSERIKTLMKAQMAQNATGTSQ